MYETILFMYEGMYHSFFNMRGIDQFSICWSNGESH